MDKVAGIADAGIKLHHIHWYVPHYTRSIKQQSILSKPVLSSTLTELRYVEPSVFMKKVKNQNLRNSELGSQKNMDVPFRIFIVFHQRDKQDTKK